MTSTTRAVWLWWRSGLIHEELPGPNWRLVVHWLALAATGFMQLPYLGWSLVLLAGTLDWERAPWVELEEWFGKPLVSAYVLSVTALFLVGIAVLGYFIVARRQTVIHLHLARVAIVLATLGNWLTLIGVLEFSLVDRGPLTAGNTLYLTYAIASAAACGVMFGLRREHVGR